MFFVLLLATTVLAACGDDDGSSGPAGSGQVRGTTWVTKELTVAGAHAATPGNSRIEITLGTDGTLRARAGCNGMSGRYTLRGDVLTVDDLSMTDMACDPDLMALDTTIATLLTAKPTVTLASGTLTVASAAVTLTLVDLESVEPTAKLLGTTWVLDTLISGDSASTVPQGVRTPITLVFGDDGRYTIDTGCNGLSGTYTTKGTTVSVTPGPTTLIGCPAPLDTLEATIGAVFTGNITTAIQRQRLTVTAKNDKGLGFTARA